MSWPPALLRIAASLRSEETDSVMRLKSKKKGKSSLQEMLLIRHTLCEFTELSIVRGLYPTVCI